MFILQQGHDWVPCENTSLLSHTLSQFTFWHRIITRDSDTAQPCESWQQLKVSFDKNFLSGFTAGLVSQRMSQGWQGVPAFISSVAYRGAWRSGPTSSSMSHDCLIAWHSVRAHTLKALGEMEILKSKEGIKAQQTVRLRGTLKIRGGAFNLTFVTSFVQFNLEAFYWPLLSPFCNTWLIFYLYGTINIESQTQTRPYSSKTL